MSASTDASELLLKREIAKQEDRRGVLSSVLKEHDLFSAQREKRKSLLCSLIERDEKATGKKVGYCTFISSDDLAISADDIPAIGDALLSIGDVDILCLIINSPGGSGHAAEKIIEVCRSYCKSFKVIVPEKAKSAATVIALGSDEIVMGYTSELGPIDPQILLFIDGVPHYISAQSFIDARKKLECKYIDALAKKEETGHLLQQMVSLNLPFIDHCEKLMEFCRVSARKHLQQHMFSSITDATEQTKAIDNVLSHLSNVDNFQVHGRMINGNAAKTELKLNVNLLGKADEKWKDIWHYYIRACTAVPKGKIFETTENVILSSTSK